MEGRGDGIPCLVNVELLILCGFGFGFGLLGARCLIGVMDDLSRRY